MTLVDYPGHIIAAALLLAVAVLLIWAYRSEKTRNIGYWRWIIGILQYIAIAVLLIIIWNPSRLLFTESTAKNSVVTVFDTSRSMSISDEEKKNRLDQAIDIYHEHFEPGKPSRPDYKIYGFDGGFYHCDSMDYLHRWGEQTNLRQVVRYLNQYGHDNQNAPAVSEGAGKVVGAIVFTDGQAANKNVSSYLPLAKKNLKVLLVGMGNTKIPGDIAIKAIKAPARVAIDTAYKIEVTVNSEGTNSEPLKVELYKDNYQIAVREVPAAKAQKTATVEFLVAADKLGAHCLEAKVPGVRNELNLANNIRRTIVNVVENARHKVLFYSQVANMDFGKIRSALEMDKKILLDVGLDAVITPLPARSGRANNRKALAGHIKLPKNKTDFYQYDIIILGPCNFDRLTDEQMEGLYSFVVERGGGLILLPGREEFDVAKCRNSMVTALIPVEFGNSWSGNTARKKAGVELTIEGINSGILTSIDMKISQELLSAYYNNLSEKPAASTMANADREPILCVHRVGRGRVCLINTYGLYRWYREDLDGGSAAKTYIGFDRISGGRVTTREAGIEVFAERIPDNPYAVDFDAYVYDKNFSLVSDATVLLQSGDQTLSMAQAGEGHYVCQMTNVRDQAILANVEAQHNGVFLGEKIFTANLLLPRSEMDRVELDREFLQKLSARINADYLDAKDIDQNTADVFPATTPVRQVSSLHSIWPRWSLLIGLCTLLTLIWFTKRAKGLI